MSGIGTVGVVATAVLLAYFVVLWIRFVVDLLQSLRGTWRPSGAALVVAEVSFTVTDPPILAVRRLLPPLRVGALLLDFGFTAVMFAVVALLYAATAIGGA